MKRRGLSAISRQEKARLKSQKFKVEEFGRSKGKTNAEFTEKRCRREKKRENRKEEPKTQVKNRTWGTLRVG